MHYAPTRFVRGFPKRVSIPFKRESIYARGFFASSSRHCLVVSIPFKRESIYARQDVRFHVNHDNRFNSLQTGKHICTHPQLEQYCGGLQFQFPSNGKAYMHHRSCKISVDTVFVSIPFKRESIYAQGAKQALQAEKEFVSIPFKRESIYARRAKQSSHTSRKSCFNSLQTGKHICT